MKPVSMAVRASPSRGRAVDGGVLVAGILTSGMGLYHFFLPLQVHWSQPLARVPMLAWALMMINACFSFLLLAGGIITIDIALRPQERDRTGAWVLAVMAGFWLFNGVYQWLAPMPLPPRLAGLRWAFLGFALVGVSLYALALRRRGAPSV